MTVDTTNKNNSSVNIEIPDEALDAIERLSNNNLVWIKPSEGGFLMNDEIVPEIMGVIVGVFPHYAKWIGNKPEKIPFTGQEAPDGFILHTDLKIDVGGGFIGLSLATTSTKAYLSPYLNLLRQSGLRPNEVLTQFKVKSVLGKQRTFNVVAFALIKSLRDEQQNQYKPETATPSLATPASPLKSTANPWKE
ncbi:MAG: hypothetical protein WCJ37_02875 [Syntrophus sp. (in: bacteria)]